MSLRTSMLCVAIGFAALATTVPVSAEDGKFHFTVLDDPQAVPPSIGTRANAINDLGVVAGDYQASGMFHGFVSTPPYSNTSYTTVDGPGSSDLWAVNLRGVVTGYYFDASGVPHGMVSRPPYTVVTSFDAPGACEDNICNGGTNSVSINLEGVIGGSFGDANAVSHGFVSYPPYNETNFTTLDAPGACSSGSACSGSGTFVESNSLTDLGAVTGYYADASQVVHGFVSYPPYSKTNFTTSDAPGACEDDVASCIGTFNGTYPACINLWGVITGTYYGADSVGHGFVSYPPYTKKTFTSFDAPGSPLLTFPLGINLEGVITGYFLDSEGVGHGFVSYRPYGKTNFTTLDAPRACSSGSACSGLGTFPEAINLEGQITGFYVDASGSRHSFVAHQ